MKLFLISYDIKSVEREEVYQRLYELLKGAKGWWHYLESTWILATNLSLEQWHQKVKETIEPEDSFIIVDITNSPRNGWLPQRAWEWLRTRRSQCNETE